MKQMNFAAELLDNSAPAEKLALLSLQGDISYGELRQQVKRVGGFLRQNGLRPGERVLIIAESSPFWVFAYLGISFAGGVSVPLPSPCEPDYLQDVIAQTGSRFVFVQWQLLRRIGTVLSGCDLVVSDLLPKRQIPDLKPLQFAELPDDQQQTSCRAGADDLATIMFTSGSTAKPRGVMISHGNICSNTLDIIDSLDLQTSDRIMAVLPFHYCFGTSLLHTHLKAGGSLVIDNRFLFPDKVLARMIETECTGLAGVPSTYQILLRQSSMKKMRFPRLRKVQQAGGKLPRIFIEELETTLSDADIFIMYGQTEATARLSCISPAERRSRPDSIGRGLKSVQLQVLNDYGVPVSPGEVGEVVATGPNIAMGYWRDKESMADTFIGGSLSTGDLGIMDADGYISIIDRKKDFLKCGGKRVSASEVEERILKFEGLIEVSVIAVPDNLLGEAVCLFAVHPQGKSVADSLKRFCEHSLARHLQPRQIIFLNSLPRNSSGKYDKRSLKRSLESYTEKNIA